MERGAPIVNISYLCYTISIMFYLAAMADASSRNSYPTHGTRYSRHLYVQSLRSKLQHAALTLRRGSPGRALSHTRLWCFYHLIVRHTLLADVARSSSTCER